MASWRGSLPPLTFTCPYTRGGDDPSDAASTPLPPRRTFPRPSKSRPLRRNNASDDDTQAKGRIAHGLHQRKPTVTHRACTRTGHVVFYLLRIVLLRNASRPSSPRQPSRPLPSTRPPFPHNRSSSRFILARCNPSSCPVPP